MSTDNAGDAGQPTLTESITSRVDARRQRRRERLSEEGAKYGRNSTATDNDHEPRDAGCCLECGTPIESRGVRRVMGDDWGRTLGCPNCTKCEREAAAARSATEGGLL